MSFYSPTIRLRRFTQVTPELLQELGVKGIVTDLDDTLAPRNVYVPDDEVSAWVSDMQKAGIRICIVSNNSKNRVKTFADPVGLTWFSRAMKPSRKGVFKALDAMGLTKDETVFLGDQLFTDMIAANRCRMRSILVEPVGDYGGWFVQVKRAFENLLRKKRPYDYE